MAKCVAVCRSDKHPFERRQLALEVDDSLTMVIQFDDACAVCEQINVSQQSELENFVHKFNALSKDELAVELMISSKKVFHSASQLLQCVGCRRSIEQLFNQLVESHHPALEPLVVTTDSYLSIQRDVLFDPKSIYALFHIHGAKLNNILDSISKNPKNKRCMLHSRDSHKAKLLGSWIDVWSIMSTECREELLLVERDSLMDTLESYLSKHRFCSECKSKVLHAYNILIGDVDFANEKGYQASLYEGLRCCAGEQHIHISCDTQYIARLITRAESDVLGSNRERHAKTLDIAQEEVLTCLGIYVYERLQKVWQRLRAEEQSWQLLFYICIYTLKKCFEISVEQKTGESSFELLLQQFEDDAEVKKEKKSGTKKESKKQAKNKKSKKANVKKEVLKEILCENCGVTEENCQCDENTNTPHIQCASCDRNHAIDACTTKKSNKLKKQQKKKKKAEKNPPRRTALYDEECCGDCHRSDCSTKTNHDRGQNFVGEVLRTNEQDITSNLHVAVCDGGYSSCGTCGSHDAASDISGSDGVCNHGGDSPLCTHSHINDVEETIMMEHHCNPMEKKRSKKCEAGRSLCFQQPRGLAGLSLMEMLEDDFSRSDEEDDFISPEDIKLFKQNAASMNDQRRLLRETLRERFNNICAPTDNE